MWPEPPAPPIPPPPSLLPLLGGMLLWLGVFLILFVLPPCATSPALDLAALGGAGGWGLWFLGQLLFPRPRPPASPSPPPAGVAQPPASPETP